MKDSHDQKLPADADEEASYYGDSRTLDVHVRRLRQKLGNPELIETITGIGYRYRKNRQVE